jgi:hypothetical protein
MEVCVIFYNSVTVEARDYNKNQFLPPNRDYNSYPYKFLLNSLPLGLIKLQTYLSILGKKLFLTFKNAFSTQMEVCVIFYISISIDARDSNKKITYSSWYGLQFIILQVFTQLTSSRSN